MFAQQNEMVESTIPGQDETQPSIVQTERRAYSAPKAHEVGSLNGMQGNVRYTGYDDHHYFRY